MKSTASTPHLGGGGALLREKIVASASAAHDCHRRRDQGRGDARRLQTADQAGSFGLTATRIAIEKTAARLGLSGGIALRASGDSTFMTDGGHYIPRRIF